MIKGWMALAIAVLIAITAYGTWDYYLKVDHPQALIDIENALATDDLIALGSISIEQAVCLENHF